MIDPSLTEEVAARFCARTLPKPEWTHQAHLRVGLWHVLRFGEDEALVRLREGITKLNEGHGVANTATGGYHETITRFYVRITTHFVQDAGRDRTIDDLAEEFIRLYGEKELPLRYWSRERLMSTKARFGWVEPDVDPLP